MKKPRSAIQVPLIIMSLLLAGCSLLPGNVTSAPEPIATQELPEVTQGKPLELSWSEPPELTIEPKLIYLATLRTAKGDVKIELFADRAPITVNNFVFLAREGYYNNTTFHRVIPGFMAQGGDPTGTGSGGPGYTFEDEISHGLVFDQAGLLAMANSGPNTNGSQFFITYAATPWLNGFHTIFGKVVEGMEVVQALAPRDPADAPETEGDALYGVDIQVVPKSSLPTPTPSPEAVRPPEASDRPLAVLPIEERENLYTGMPELTIELDKQYSASIVTTKGTIVIALEALSAPQSVNNFIHLANLGYWDNFPINAVQEGAYTLTGSPFGRPDSDIGYKLPSENGLEAKKGAIAYWFRQDILASSGSRILFLLDDLPGFEQFYTIFGYTTQGQNVIDALTVEDEIVRISIITR
jgi:cyclophilin family peptidyl-prolyl cis-trans isomerase